MNHCPPNSAQFEATIIGGGFYGCAIAIYLAKKKNFKKILLLEAENKLLSRASYHNQARVHNGYHYPRSFTTAYRSRVNFLKFINEWPSVTYKSFTKIYAIARLNSKVTGRQFRRFCTTIGASLEPADASLRQLFDPRLIEEIFLAKEYAFNAVDLLHLAEQELAESGVQVFFRTKVQAVKNAESGLELLLKNENQAEPCVVSSSYVFNCTYSGLNQLGGDYAGAGATLKHEIAEMALVRMPNRLQGLGITVMDGAFFSTMPFPARQLHTLSHVRYTPHLSWIDSPGVDPYEKLRVYPKETRVDRMFRDVRRYLPAIDDATYVDSLFEVKTVLMKNEADDGRPIFFEAHKKLKGFFSILGGKIDNIFDVLEKLDEYTIQP